MAGDGRNAVKFFEVFNCSLLPAGSSIAVKVNECRAWRPGAGRGSRADRARGDRAPGVEAGRAGREEAGRGKPGVPGGAGRTGRELFTIRLGAVAAGYRLRAIGSAGRMITAGLG